MPLTNEAEEPGSAEQRRRASDDAATLAMFAVMWAGAALWHLFGNPRFGAGWSEALLVVAAGLVLWRPSRMAPLALLAVAGLLAVWEEAPVTGNHWVLAGFVNLALLLSLLVSYLPSRRSEPVDLVRRFVPAARLCLVVAYAFAAFSKLNSSFLDPGVSCAGYYFEATTDSVGLGALQLDGARWVLGTVIAATVLIELSIPVLLVIRRTRNLGVVVGLVFHGLLALDRTNHVYDFSATLFPLFILFLPATAGAWAMERVGSVHARLALVGERIPRLVHMALVAGAVSLGLLLAAGAIDVDQAVTIGWVAWQPYALICILAVLRYLQQRPAAATRRAFRPHHAIFLIVPLLVLANGFTPYLELKSSYGWNMYSNLRTVDGESNHLIIGRTLPLSDIQADQVRIVSTDDPALAHYEAHGYALTWQQFRIFLSEHPDVHVVYDRGSARRSLAPASADPDLVAPVAGWREKLQPFRPIDLQEAVRCVPAFGPAR